MNESFELMQPVDDIFETNTETVATKENGSSQENKTHGGKRKYNKSLVLDTKKPKLTL